MPTTEAALHRCSTGHGCSPVNLLHIFRTTFPKNTPGRLLLPTDIYSTLQNISQGIFSSRKKELYWRPRKFQENKPGNFSSLGKQMIVTAIMTLRKRWKQIFISTNLHLG